MKSLISLKQIASFLLAILLSTLIIFTSVIPVYAADEISSRDNVELDKYSFLETFAGAFNFFYIPDFNLSSLSTWDSVKEDWSSYFDFILREINAEYTSNLNSSFVDFVTKVLPHAQVTLHSL